MTTLIPMPSTYSEVDEAWLESVFYALPSVVVVVDRAGIIRFMNAATENFFSISAASACGTEAAATLHLPATLVADISTVCRTGARIKQYDISAEHSGFSKPVASLHLAPVSLDAAAETYDVVLLMDILDAPDVVRQQHVRQGTMRSAEMMAAMLAHEVKNPLSGIRGAAQLLQDQAGTNPKLTSLICREVDRIAALLDHMEIFSGDGLKDRHAVNIHEVMEHVRAVAESSFAAGTKITFSYDPSLPEVSGDKDSLIQLFLNLVKNAAEAVRGKENGVIRLTTRYELNHRMKLAGAPVSLPIAVGVEDNGGGVPEAMRPLIFDPFVTGKTGGKGLGLAIVAKIVTDHNGTIELDSGKPGWARFKVLLPAYKAQKS